MPEVRETLKDEHDAFVKWWGEIERQNATFAARYGFDAFVRLRVRRRRREPSV